MVPPAPYGQVLDSGVPSGLVGRVFSLKSTMSLLETSLPLWSSLHAPSKQQGSKAQKEAAGRAGGSGILHLCCNSPSHPSKARIPPMALPLPPDQEGHCSLMMLPQGMGTLVKASLCHQLQKTPCFYQPSKLKDSVIQLLPLFLLPCAETGLL